VLGATFRHDFLSRSEQRRVGRVTGRQEMRASKWWLSVVALGFLPTAALAQGELAVQDLDENEPVRVQDAKAQEPGAQFQLSATTRDDVGDEAWVFEPNLSMGLGNGFEPELLLPSG
jgi:hypothetical protein